MTETIDVLRCLLTQKPDSPPPTEGDIKCFSIEQKVSKAGKPWTKAKNSTPDKGGESYRILAAEQTDHVDSYGNVSFSVQLEKTASPATSTPSAPENHATGTTGAGNATPRDDYAARGQRIERQHSQEMALRYATLKGLTTIEPEDLRLIIDWFAKDISHDPGEGEF